jgi:hypothetical protein
VGQGYRGDHGKYFLKIKNSEKSPLTLHWQRVRKLKQLNTNEIKQSIDSPDART